jgi:hypothetical protein
LRPRAEVGQTIEGDLGRNGHTKRTLSDEGHPSHVAHKAKLRQATALRPSDASLGVLRLRALS